MTAQVTVAVPGTPAGALAPRLVVLRLGGSAALGSVACRVCRPGYLAGRSQHHSRSPALRWLFDDTRISQLARDNGISVSTAYAYRDEAIMLLAARKPSLRGALLAAKAAGHTHVILDGTLIPTDRISTPALPAEWTCVVG